MYHKIGTLAKRFGITPQALRFYERHGLLLSVRESEGGDRRYQSRNLKWLCSIRRYHDLGYSLEDTLTLFSCESTGELDAMAAEREAETRRELEVLERRLEALRLHREDLARIPRLFRSCEVVEMPRLWLLLDQEGQDVDLAPALQGEVREWIQFLPWVYEASVVKQTATGSKGIRKSGFCVEEKDAIKLGLSLGKHTVLVGGGKAIHTVATLRRINDVPEAVLDHAYAFAKEKGLNIHSDFIGRCLAKTGEIHCKEDLCPQAIYYEYWLPIE